MSRRVTVVLLLLLVVLGGGALLLHERRAAQRPAELAKLGQPLFPHLEAAKITAISLRDSSGTLKVELRTGAWVLGERGDFPADYAKVKDFVIKALELRTGQVEPVDAADRTRLKLLAPGEGAGAGTLVEFRGADGKPLASMIVGEKYFKKTPEDAASARADGRFVMLPRDTITAYVVGDPLAQASATSAAWIDHTGLALENLSSLEYRPAQGAGWKIERASATGDWALDDAKPGEKLDPGKANAAAYALGSVPLDDVAPPDAQPATTGLAAPATITATSFDGLSYTLQLGSLAGADYYATLRIAGTPRSARAAAQTESAADKAKRDKEFSEQLTKLEARLPRERALQGHVLLLPRASLDDLLKTRADLLQKREQPKQS